MKKVEWTDRQGWKHAALVRDGDSLTVAKAGAGIPIEPPDISLLDWDAIKRDLHNELINRGLFTEADMIAAQSGVTGAILAAVRPQLTKLFRQGG